MSMSIKHKLSALLIAAAVALPALTCAAADARINQTRQAPAANVQEVGFALPQAEGIQTPPSGFDWGDAGIGAAGTLALMALGSAVVTSRRRHGRQAAVR
jgi:uncharacterized protein (TIGR03382 family)